jgi:hypothetical protein
VHINVDNVTATFLQGPDDVHSEAPSEFAEITSLSADFGQSLEKNLTVMYDEDEVRT